MERMAKRKSNNWKVLEPSVQYFERTDLGEKLSDVEPIQSSVKISKREFVVTVNNTIAKNLTLIAKKKRVSSTTLLQRWVNEKIAENSTTTR